MGGALRYGILLVFAVDSAQRSLLSCRYLLIEYRHFPCEQLGDTVTGCFDEQQPLPNNPVDSSTGRYPSPETKSFPTLVGSFSVREPASQPLFKETVLPRNLSLLVTYC